MIYTRCTEQLALGDLHFDTDDIRLLLAMTGTTAGAEEDALTIQTFTTLDEFDGLNYVQKALSSKTVTKDNANNWTVFDAGDVTWTSLGAGTRDVAAAIIYQYINGSADIPLFYLPFSKSPSGGNVTLEFNSGGIARIKV